MMYIPYSPLGACGICIYNPHYIHPGTVFQTRLGGALMLPLAGGISYLPWKLGRRRVLHVCTTCSTRWWSTVFCAISLSSSVACQASPIACTTSCFVIRTTSATTRPSRTTAVVLVVVKESSAQLVVLTQKTKPYCCCTGI